MEPFKYRIIRMSRNPSEIYYVVEQQSYGVYWNRLPNSDFGTIREAEEYIERWKQQSKPWKKEVVREYS